MPKKEVLMRNRCVSLDYKHLIIVGMFCVILNIFKISTIIAREIFFFFFSYFSAHFLFVLCIFLAKIGFNFEFDFYTCFHCSHNRFVLVFVWALNSLKLITSDCSNDATHRERESTWYVEERKKMRLNNSILFAY